LIIRIKRGTDDCLFICIPRIHHIREPVSHLDSTYASRATRMNSQVIVPNVFLVTFCAGALCARADGGENGHKEVPFYPGAAPDLKSGIGTSEQ
jgi:hypothetical protein